MMQPTLDNTRGILLGDCKVCVLRRGVAPRRW